MKKIVGIFMLIVFVFSAFYPIAYGVENTITNETVETNEVSENNMIANEKKVEEIETEKETELENISSEEVKQENIILEEPTPNEEENFVNITTETEHISEKSAMPKIEEEENVIPQDRATIQKNYDGMVHIETPANNQNYTMEANKMQIVGWAVANDEKVNIKIYVNDWLWAEIYERTERKDVNAIANNYGGITKKAGFRKEIDISDWKAGTYTIRVEQVARDGKIIGRDSRNIKVASKEYRGTMYIDSPSANSTYKLPDIKQININGWAVSNDKNSYLLVSIDGKPCSYTLDRTIREDINTVISPAYGGVATTPKAGFSINLDINNLFEGKHIITIMEVSRFDKILASLQIPINISTPNYPALMNLETPVQNRRYRSGWLEVKGWAITESKNDFVDIYLDGNYAVRAEGKERSDVVDVYQGQFGVNNNSKPGFYSQVNTSMLGEGTHTLKVVHYSGYGKELGAREIKFIISNTTTWGIDASHYQGAVDWNAVRNSGVNFAILKIGEYSESKHTFFLDAKFNEYYDACKRNGIAVGGYIYSYEFNAEEASHEAQACLNAIQGKSFEMPIFLDIEDKIIKNAILSGKTTVENVTNGAVTFCNMMNSHGYQAGVYADKTFFTRYLNAGILEQYNIWLAHWTSASSSNYPGRYDLWQYTDAGSIPGISGPVDLNWCFKRYY